MLHIILILGSVFGAGAVRDGDFMLAVETLSALKEGPHVVKLTLTYLGSDPVSVRLYKAPISNLRLRSQSPTFSIFPIRGFISDASDLTESVRFSKGTSISECHYLHHLDQPYPPNGLLVTAESSFTYRQISDGSSASDPRNVQLRTSAVLTRSKPSQQRLEKISGQLVTRLSEKFDGESWEEAQQWLSNTRHVEFSPVAIRMLDATSFEERESFSFQYLVDCAGSGEAATRLVISELRKPYLASANVFVAWKHSKRLPPSAKDIGSLLTAPNVWVSSP